MLTLFYLLSSFAYAQVIHLNRIIDRNDFVLVQDDLGNIPQRYHRAADSVGRLSIGCTATHLGNGYVVSAGHCFGAKKEIIENQSCDKIKVAWGYRGTSDSSLVSKCKKVLVMQNSAGLDYALFQVLPFPAQALEIETTFHVVSNLSLSLFSHPNGNPLTWSQLCPARMRESVGDSKPSLYHQCDTEPGSSGAALINDANLKIIAIHSGSGIYRDIGIWNYSTLIVNTPIVEYIELFNVKQ